MQFQCYGYAPGAKNAHQSPQELTVSANAGARVRMSQDNHGRAPLQLIGGFLETGK